jgi:outer membrane protein assembly factor BamB
MFRRSVPVWVLFMIVASAPARAQMPFPRDLIPSRSSLERLGLERHWYTVLPFVETERLIKINRSSDLLFAQTDYGWLHTYDAETGKLLWSAQLGIRQGRAVGAAANSFAVFAADGDTLYALDRRSGRAIWKLRLSTYPASAPACDEHRVMVGLYSGILTGYNLKKSDAKGNETLLGIPLLLWNWKAGGPIATRPVPAENIVAFGGGNGKVYGVMAFESTELFRFSTGGAIGEGLGTVGTRILLAPSGDFVLYAIDILTGESVWTFPSGAPIEHEPVVADQDVFVLNLAGSMSLLDPTSGTPRWTTATQGKRVAAVSATKLYVRTQNLDLFVMDRATGRITVEPSEARLRAGLNLRDYDLDFYNRFDDRLYFATKSGMVICLSEIGQSQPRPLRDPKSQPFGYIPPEGIKLTPPVPPAAEPGAEPAAEPRAEQPPAAEPPVAKPPAAKPPAAKKKAATKKGKAAANTPE